MNTRDLAVLHAARTAGSTGRGRRVREAARLTQAEVAAAVGVSRGTIAMWESGRRVPSGNRALAYGRLLRSLDKT